MRLIYTLSLVTFSLVSCISQNSETDSEYASKLNHQAVEILYTKPDSALILLDKASEIDPNLSAVYNNKIRIFCSRKDYINAIETSNQLLKTKPELAEAASFLGMLYDFTGNSDKAREHYQRAIDLYDKRLTVK